MLHLLQETEGSLLAWWEEHKILDAARLAIEKQHKTLEDLRRDALAKLSQEERNL